MPIADVLKREVKWLVFDQYGTVVGAKSYGMRAAFIDRRRRPLGGWSAQPDLIVEDFAALAATLV